MIIGEDDSGKHWCVNSDSDSEDLHWSSAALCCSQIIDLEGLPTPPFRGSPAQFCLSWPGRPAVDDCEEIKARSTSGVLKHLLPGIARLTVNNWVTILEGHMA